MQTLQQTPNPEGNSNNSEVSKAAEKKSDSLVFVLVIILSSLAMLRRRNL
ncbi:hypothetical protein [Marinicellulosiphila megalodicopiae]